MLLVTGATGFVGKRVCRFLSDQGRQFARTSLSLGCDLRDLGSTTDLFRKVRPTHIINCAAYVGGIQFGIKRNANIFHNNMLMTLNLLSVANEFGVRRIVNPISNCAYPAKAKVFRESEFWDGPLHDSVLAYGITRKAACVGAWAYNKQYGLDVVNIVLSNMYGPEDHFDEERSHALGALIMKIVRAKMSDSAEVVVWGSGKPVREWLHVDDGAEALVRGLEIAPTLEPVNIGMGFGISILEAAQLIKKFVGYEGSLVLDESKPDGAMHKTVDGRRGRELFGWSPTRPFQQGLRETILWYVKNGNN